MKIKMLCTAAAMMLPMFSLYSPTTMSGGVEATPTQAEEQAAEAGKSARGSVSRETFTTGIQDNEPIDNLEEIENSVPIVYFFAELIDMAGQTATHRWKYGDTVMAEAKIAVKNSRFAAWSSNKMAPESTGLWIVEVLDGKGEVISTNSFNYIAPL